MDDADDDPTSVADFPAAGDAPEALRGALWDVDGRKDLSRSMRVGYRVMLDDALRRGLNFLCFCWCRRWQPSSSSGASGSAAAWPVVGGVVRGSLPCCAWSHKPTRQRLLV